MQSREQVTQAILVAKVQKGITWQEVSEAGRAVKRVDHRRLLRANDF